MNKYTWGVDGYGRKHICERSGQDVLLCMLPGSGGLLGVLMLEEQDKTGRVSFEMAGAA